MVSFAFLVLKLIVPYFFCTTGLYHFILLKRHICNNNLYRIYFFLFLFYIFLFCSRHSKKFKAKMSLTHARILFFRDGFLSFPMFAFCFYLQIYSNNSDNVKIYLKTQGKLLTFTH